MMMLMRCLGWRWVGRGVSVHGYGCNDEYEMVVGYMGMYAHALANH